MKVFALLLICVTVVGGCSHSELETPCRVSASAGATNSDPCQFLPINLAASKSESEKS